MYSNSSHGMGASCSVASPYAITYLSPLTPLPPSGSCCHPLENCLHFGILWRTVRTSREVLSEIPLHDGAHNLPCPPAAVLRAFAEELGYRYLYRTSPAF